MYPFEDTYLPQPLVSFSWHKQVKQTHQQIEIKAKLKKEKWNRKMCFSIAIENNNNLLDTEFFLKQALKQLKSD